MKALSIRQPWAWLIVNGHKPVENRTWETLYRGPLMIHAGLQMTRADHEACLIFMAGEPLMARIISQMPRFEDFPRGGIVGQAELVACLRDHESPFFVGPFGFVLQDARPLSFLPCKGALGIFNLRSKS